MAVWRALPASILLEAISKGLWDRGGDEKTTEMEVIKCRL
jgi:hypothetical protein